MIYYPLILPQKKRITGKKPNCSIFSQIFKVKFAAKLKDIQSLTLYFAKLRSCCTNLQVLCYNAFFVSISSKSWRDLKIRNRFFVFLDSIKGL